MDRLGPHTIFILTVAVVTLFAVATAHAAGTPEQACQKGRFDAAAKYAACEQKATGKIVAGGTTFAKFQQAISQCRVKYTATYGKLRAKALAAATVETCDAPRFTDNGTTVTDNLTELQWEKKTDDATIHDKGNGYPWTAGVGGTAADGPVFTTFLPALNTAGCFAGQCDWRLPTRGELLTILSEAYPCTTSPCIDPVFGPTDETNYWAATTDASFPLAAWNVVFFDGNVGTFTKIFNLSARAVRGGL